jgi:hypothetical protein
MKYLAIWAGIFLCSTVWAADVDLVSQSGPKITCAQDLFGRYAQCSGLPLGQLCAIQKGKKIVWGSCTAASSDSEGDIYCLCESGN